ncbi:MAG: transposase [Thermoanaerobacteraceae bacterium]|nr:transposase [Thermoanaerobacteraceae bacterium]
MLEVTAMQQIFYTPVPPEEYARLGKDFPFPQPTSCPNPGCLVKVPPQKYGFYQRNAIGANFCGRILIRRYYCKYCRTTISYLPSFCLPYFQYSVEIIFIALWYTLALHHSFPECLKLLKESFEHLHWGAGHLHGLDGLKPGYRSDRGKSRRVTDEIALKIQEKIQANPRLRASLLYDELVADGVFTPDKLSLATFYRYLAQHPHLAAGKEPGAPEKEVKRFAHQWVNELWQTDVMYGPYLKVGRVKKQTFLIAFIDDASRLITHGQFCWEQNFNAVRAVFKEAVLKRGIPKMHGFTKPVHPDPVRAVCHPQQVGP